MVTPRLALIFFFFFFFWVDLCRLQALQMLNRYTLLDLRSGGLAGLPPMPKGQGKRQHEATKKERKDDAKEIKEDKKDDQDGAPKGVLRGARTTLDAVRKTSRPVTGITNYAGDVQAAGIGGHHLQENGFMLGGSSALICAERIGALPTSPKAVRVWIFLKDSGEPEVMEEYKACHASGQSTRCTVIRSDGAKPKLTWNAFQPGSLYLTLKTYGSTAIRYMGTLSLWRKETSGRDHHKERTPEHSMKHAGTSKNTRIASSTRKQSPVGTESGD